MDSNKIKEPIGEVGEGVGFERIRRITGYLVGDVKHFNDAKKAELNDRVKHKEEVEREEEYEL